MISKETQARDSQCTLECFRLSAKSQKQEITMTIDDAIYLEDALDCQSQGMTKDDFVGCVMERAKARNAQAYDDALALTAEKGSRRKAMNYVARELEAAPQDYFPS
jgi:hypothetical protein